MKKHIIAIAGRKGSGKTEIAKHLLENNFIDSEKWIKISFADYLKKLCSDLYCLDISYFTDPVLKETTFSSPLLWNYEKCQELSWLIDEDQDFVDLVFSGDKIFVSPRQIIQYIGTDILKKYDHLFSVKKTISSLDPFFNYICDDLRFPEEKAALENIKSHQCSSFFVIRPQKWTISNHKSETSLKWSDFNSKNVIINNVDIGVVMKRFQYQMESGKALFQENSSFNQDCDLRIIDRFLFNSNAQYFGAKTDHSLSLQIVSQDWGWICDFRDYVNENRKDSMSIPAYLLNYVDSEIYSETSMTLMIDSNAQVLEVACPYVLENIKFWYRET